MQMQVYNPDTGELEYIDDEAYWSNPDYVEDTYTYSYGDDDYDWISNAWDTLTNLGSDALKGLTNVYTKPGGGIDWKNVAATAGGLYGLYQSRQPQQQTGYQGKIPKYTAVRAPVQNTYDPNRRPGSGGQRYFTQMEYVPEEGDVGAAVTRAEEKAAGLAALNAANPAREERPTPTEEAVLKGDQSADVNEGRAPSEVIEDLPVEYAAGGLTGMYSEDAVSPYAENPTDQRERERMNMAAGGLANLAKGRYLDGQTDGMADKIPARIDGEQEARLSHGEFVIPADVVSHLGNGNSEAGAERLYAMMDKIRQARTGNKKQGKQINPNKFLPA